MKKTLLILSLIATIAITFFACSEREHTNPLDSEYWSGSGIDSPVSFTKTVVSIDQIQLQWTVNADYPEGYKFRIDKKVGTDDWKLKYKIIPSTQTLVTDTAEINKELSYRIYVSYDENTSESKLVTYINTFPAPTNLTVAQNNVSTFTLNWTDNSTGEDGFKIERKIDDGAYTVIATITGTSYVDNSVLKKGYGIVYYQVRAYKGTDSYSNYATTNSAVTFPAPTNLTATQTSITIANLSWTDNSIGEEKFEIERKRSTESTYIKVAEVTGSDTATKSWADATVIPNLTYDYRVRAIKGINNTAYISKTLINIFQAPTGLIATQNNVSTFTLNWTDNSTGEDGFKIERRIDDGANSVIATVTGTNYVDNTVSKGFGTVYYQVRAYKGTNYSTYVTANSAVSFPAPTNLMVTQTNITSANLSWTDNSIGEEKFEIERKLSTESTYIKVAEVSGSDTATKSWADATVIPNLTYDYRVRAIKGINITAYLSKTLINLFQAPTGLTATQDNIFTFTLNWTDNTPWEDGYKIERKIDDGAYTVIATVTGTSYVDNTVSKGYGTVYYQVRAYKGTTYFSSYATVNSEVLFPAPTNLTATQTSITSANLSWTDNSIGEEKFEIERKLSTESTYLKVAEVTGSNTSTKSWIDAAIIPNLIYDYRLRAIKGINNTAYISKTLINIFQAPTGLTATQNNVYTFTLNWTDNSTGEDGFKIERKIDGGTYTVIATVTGSSYVDNTVSKGYGTVYYQVRAYKGTTYSSYAITNSAVSFPAPSNLTVTQTSITSANLSWTDNSIGEDKFEIERKISTETIYAKIAEVTGSDTATKSWIDDSIIPNLTCDYRVRAVKGTNSSAYIARTLVNTFPAPTTMSIARITIVSANLSWYDNSIGEEKFEIERKLSTESTYLKVAEVSGSDTATKSWIDVSIIPNLIYDYRVRAVKGIYGSAYIARTFDNIFPAPTNLTAAVASETSIKLDWTDNSTGEEGYKIDRKIEATGIWLSDYATVGANVKTYTDTDTGLTAGTTYYYRVRAYYSTFFSSYTSEIYITSWDMSRFVSIPTGSFSMGSTACSDEQPIHTVNITRPFYLGKYEVTQKEWQTIMGSNPASGYGVCDNYPVYYVSWYSILVYCNKRSIAEGLTPCYTISGSTDPAAWGTVPTSSDATWNAVTCNFAAKGYRLPTEAEWEYAARYNDGRTYPWGETEPSSTLCNYNSNVGVTTAVDSYPSGNSNLGLCDIAGNVWEWVWDWYGTYPSTAQTDPSGLTTAQSYRVLRGGGWCYALLRCAYRDYSFPDLDDYDSGFRLSRTK